jgi:hypothetical protein
MSNAPNPQHDSALVIIGGLVADVDAVNLPAGAAAICTDMDFTVGATFSRDGLANVYSYEGSDITAQAGFGDQIQTDLDQTPWSSPTNIELNNPPNYASVVLNLSAGGGGSTALDQQTTNSGVSAEIATGPLTPTVAGEWALLAAVAGFLSNDTVPTYTPDVGWSVFSGAASPGIVLGQPLPTTAPISGDIALNTTPFANTVWAAGLYTFGLQSLLTSPTIVQQSGATTGPNNGTVYDFTNPITQGNSILFFILANIDSSVGVQTFTVSDTLLNDYEIIADVNVPGAGGGTFGCRLGVALAQNSPAGANALTLHSTWGSGLLGGTSYAIEISGLGALVGTTDISEILRAYAYALGAIPIGSQVTGFEVAISGFQNSADPASIITVNLLNPTNPGPTFTVQLPSSQGTVTLGGPTNLWDQPPARSGFENSNFGFSLQASANVLTTFNVSAVAITVWYTPPGVTNFDFITSFEMTNGSLFTLALDDAGNLWQEDVINNPGVLEVIYDAIEPDSFAQSVTYDDREWIAISNNQEATDMPRQYNGQWVDRVSQVGPGAPPAVTSTSTDYAIVSITQNPPESNPATPGTVVNILWSSGPGSTSPGNVISIYYRKVSLYPEDPLLVVGQAVVLAGMAPVNGQAVDGTYVITGIGSGVPPGGADSRWFFTVQAQSTQSSNMGGGQPGTYQLSLATLTTATPIPNVQVGSQISISGASVPAWDATWTILNTPNAAQMQITADSRSTNVVTYDFTLITGTAPIVGQQVTVVGTTNGNGAFNVSNAIISAVSPGTFSIVLNGPNVAPAAEASAQAITNGTKFQFDPGLNFVGSMTSPIFGNSTGGTITQPGNLGAGTRQAVVFFITRNDAITACSPPVTFTLNEGANSLVVSNIPIGPPNVIKRAIAFTGAGGAFFYWIEQPVQVTSNGQKLTYTATVINDNTSTEATFTFTDGVLLNSTEIDVQGNNLFEQIELGSCLGFIAFANRMFAIGEQNKIQNLINLSFDGGYLNPLAPQPLGWTADAVFGANGSLVVSPLFGDAYEITNATGSTISGATGMIWQTAFQDYLMEPIINTNTQYGVRVTAASIGTSNVGNLVIDLFSPSLNRIFGSFTVPLSSMSATSEIFTGDLLTAEFFSSVTSDLQYRIYATGLGNGASIVIDRSEPFDLSQPVLTTQFRASYFANFEAFDDVTGNLGWAIENQQELRNAFALYDTLYGVRTRSMASTVDNGITEPDGWTTREVSNKVGTPSIHGVDVGEGWAIIVGEAGSYIFDGGQPIKFSQELDPLWLKINWAFGYTIWVKNDTNNRRLSIGIPIPTPNQWMPDFPSNPNPTQPNVVLICQYKELMSSSAIAGEGPVRQSYTGALKSYQLGRKWSAWSIQAAYADFILRGDTTMPLFYCGDTGTAKIYQQLTGNHLDDGAAILDDYVTYPFLKSEEAQQLQAGLHNIVAEFCTALVIGSGELTVTVYPNTLDSPYAEVLEPPLELLNPPPYGDTEIPVNVPGNRFFVGFKTKVPGDWFQLSRVVLNVIMDPWAPTRGSN